MYRRWRAYYEEIDDAAAADTYYVSSAPSDNPSIRKVAGTIADADPWLERSQLLIGTEGLRRMAE
eukprot:CAMPEP_0172165474 /NCGR_PEP_ID=MMETSP1050-20130122/8432_1 /TAXON_ID=233186 /ORGANISM="Cryptomonas curvata, Strain CCAP979/52" /LENGTH=64 /DNA_ID=CAMNT_0012835949 /DNA_START=1 /DNA_END=192 /DNA_ORIENTATION=-